MKTICINLFGGPGCGKSTLAAEVFSALKQRGESVELVREYVKTLAWQGAEISATSHLYLLGKQASYESKLYGKVKYIVTDSPVLLAGVYALRRPNCEYVSAAALGFVRGHADEVEHVNFLLARRKKYDPNGRYETEPEARKMDEAIQLFLAKNLIHYDYIEPTVHDVLCSLRLANRTRLERFKAWVKQF